MLCRFTVLAYQEELYNELFKPPKHVLGLILGQQLSSSSLVCGVHVWNDLARLYTTLNFHHHLMNHLLGLFLALLHLFEHCVSSLLFRGKLFELFSGHIGQTSGYLLLLWTIAILKALWSLAAFTFIRSLEILGCLRTRLDLTLTLRSSRLWPLKSWLWGNRHSSRS